MKIHESMNVSLLHKKILLLLLTAFLWIGGQGLLAQSNGLDVIHETVLKDSTKEFTFKHWHVSIPPEIKGFPTNGTAEFNPHHSWGTKFGITSTGGQTPANNHLFYTPDPGFIGHDTIEVYYYRYLGNGNSIGAYKIYNITVVPSFLYSENDYASTQMGQAVEINVLTNDYGNGTNLSISEIPNVNNGTASKINGDTTVLFTPAAGFSGIAHLNYTICDAEGSCDMATVSICVIDNTPPAYDSIFVTTEKNASQVVLMAIDSNYSILLAPSHGQLDSLETLVYVPDINYVGYDKVMFEDSASNRIRVFEIRVLDVEGDNTFLFDDVVYTPVDESIEEIHLLDNDNGSKYLANVSAIGYPSTLQGGQLTYLPQIGKGVYKYVPPAGFEGIDQFDYRATPPYSGAYEYATCYIVVSDLDPSKPVFNVITPKNTPIVLGDHLPFENYEFININQGNLGTVDFYPGQQTVTSSYGQEFSGFNMLVYTPIQDTIGLDEFEAEYCPGAPGSGCQLVKVDVDIVEVTNPQSDTLCAGGDCVWAGDTNKDGTVDIRDILPIGLCMGEVGDDRLNGSMEWYGQYANNWNNLFNSIGFDAKHIDADGNGIVTSSDTSAISEFYGKYHNLTPTATGAIEELPFYIEEPDFSNIEPGDILYAPIHLGNDSIPALDAYGLTFEIEFDPTLFEAVNVLFNESSWMSYNSPILSMSYKPVNGKVDAGITRTSGAAASGYGIIGVVEFIVINDVNGNRLNSNSTTVNLRSLGMMNGSGQTLNIGGNSITFHFNLNEGGSNQYDIASHQLVVFPNPTSDVVNVHLNGSQNEMERVVLFNVVGNAVYDSGTLNAKSVQLDVSDLAQGMYLMKVWANDGTVLNNRFEVIKR
jgi:Big-like domain-containing protein/type IX secretion system substrate protein